MEPLWIENICLVKFDIEIGQIVEWQQPLHSLTAQEEKALSMSSFPDSNSFAQNEGSIKYVFRMRRESAKQKFSFGYTLFMQRKDEDNPRGFTLKSIVILSSLPFINFYYSILDQIYKNIKSGCLKNQLQLAFEQIQEWDLPQTGKLFSFHLFTKQFVIEIPKYIAITKVNQKTQQLPNALNNLPLQDMIQMNDLRERGQFQETNIYSALPHQMLTQLPKLWELVLTNQSFMVIADSPSQGSEIILGAISLMSPLTFTGDYRPYFTIYDKEFQLINQELEKSIARNIIIGVTNPFFIKSFSKFPIILRCDSSCQQGQQRFILQGKQLCIGEDKQIGKMLLPLQNEEKKYINNSVIKKYFKNMTLEFIGLFELYFQQQPEQIKKFDEKAFLEVVKSTQLSYSDLFSDKSKIIKLYQNFIRSSNFITFLNERQNVYIGKGNTILQ